MKLSRSLPTAQKPTRSGGFTLVKVAIAATLSCMLPLGALEDPLFLWMPGSDTLHVRTFVFTGQINGHVVTRMVDTIVNLQYGAS